MSAKIEAFLAKIYVDANFRARFLADMRSVAASYGLNERQTEALAAMDLTGLKMTALSISRKTRRKLRKT